ncbi:MAG: ribosomal protein [Acidobacteria bacterium]|jgi:large subunit ribosomal protein L15|nr:ribosomal protein [Acidobacteriota bacterium]
MSIALNKLRPARGANKRNKRIGRGIGSGHGKTATRGYNGQLSRSGTSVRPGFEGGQMPLHRRLPKRGFNNIFRVEYAIVNIARLAKLDARMPIDPALLKEKGIIKNLKDGVKVLGSGELKKALHVRAHKFSKKAAEIIQNAGGTVEIIGKPATT